MLSKMANRCSDYEDTFFWSLNSGSIDLNLAVPFGIAMVKEDNRKAKVK